MKRSAATLLLLAACGSPGAARAPDVALDVPPLHRATPPQTPPRSIESELDLAAFVESTDVQELLGAANMAGYLNLAAVRDHAVGPRVRELLDTSAPGTHLLDDIEWVLMAASGVAHMERALTLIRARPGVDIDWNVARVLRGSPSSARGGEVEIEGARAWRLRGDGDRIAIRVRDDLVAIVEASRASAVVRTFRSRALGSPPTNRIAAVYARRDAHLGPLMMLSHELEECRVVVEPRSDGGMDLRLDARIADVATATAMAKELEDRLGWVKSAIHMPMRKPLDDAKVTANGDSIALALHADDEQVRSLVEAVAASP